MRTFTFNASGTDASDGVAEMTVPFDMLRAMGKVGNVSIRIVLKAPIFDNQPARFPVVTWGFSTKEERDAKYAELLAVWGEA